jgi:hypothetical protein
MKCFVLIRKDILSYVQVGVQGAHALAELVGQKDEIPSVADWLKNHKTLIFLAATEEDIKNAKAIALHQNIKWADFIEPDMGDMLTAVAFEPCDKMLGKHMFGHLKLV